MDDAKQQLLQRIQTATNILVTVSTNPSVDQLAACIGMTLWLNKIGKHSTAVFSGEIPDTMEFLQPEATIEKTTDSLRDFIIALDKSKADKLRYKVEDRVVKIFITPYRTNLSADDLEFSQGDFNVDAIVAIGVSEQQDLDNAIISHGRILHDATVITINTTKEGGLGSVNWHDPAASSLSELVYDLCHNLDPAQIDPQIATALMTGIVAETNRFSNSKTTPNTMSVSAALMSAGANQQLVANKLEQAVAAKPAETNQENNPPATTGPPAQQTQNDGTLEIAHNTSQAQATDSQVAAEPDVQDMQLPKAVEEATSQPEAEVQPPQTAAETQGVQSEVTSNQKLVTEPPSLGGTLTANSRPDDMPEPTTDPFSLPKNDDGHLLDRKPLMPAPVTAEPLANTPSAPNEPQQKAQINDNETLSQIEQAVGSPHIDNIRDQVQDALKSGPLPEPEPVESLNAINVDLGQAQEVSKEEQPAKNPMQFDPKSFAIEEPQEDEKRNPNDPPQVPPPFIPPNFMPPSPPQQ